MADEMEDDLRLRAQDQNQYWSDRAVPGSQEADQQFQNELVEVGPGDMITRGARQTAAYGLYRYAKDQWGLEKDPTFNASENWQEITKGVPSEYHADLMEADSMAEVQKIKARIMEDQNDLKVLTGKGYSGMAALIAGSIFDVDLVLAPLTDGAYTAAKVGRAINNARLAKTVSMGASGLISGAVVEGANAAVRETTDWTDIPQAALAGMVMGGALGTVLPTKKALMASASRGMDDFHTRMKDDPDLGELPDPYAGRYGMTMDQAKQARKARFESSAGSRANPDRPPLKEDFVDDPAQDVIEQARDYLDQSGNRGMARRFTSDTWLDKAEDLTSGLTTDWGRFTSTESSVMQWLRQRMLESPSGRGGRQHTAALDREMYMRRMLEGMPDFDMNYAQWAKSNGANLTEVHYKDNFREAFGKEVSLEMNYRRLNNAENPTQHPNIKAAADALERQGKVAFDIQKGMTGENPVDGFEGMTYKRGYTPFRHNGTAMLKAMQAGTPKKDIVALFAKGYERALGVDPKVSKTMADALVTRALKKTQEMDVSVHSLLTADGRSFLRESLLNNGVTARNADSIVEALGGKIEERGKLGHAKERNELDLSLEHEGLKLIDFMDNNLNDIWNRYARNASGAAALARMGITNRTQRSTIRDAIIQEQNNLGEAPVSAQFIDDVFSYFDGGPVAGGTSPVVSRLKKFTNLSVLNMLGLTQMGETGALIAAVGVENFMAHSPIANRFFQNMAKGKTDNILEDIAPWTGRIWDEEKLIDPSIDFSGDRMQLADQHEYMQHLDRFLAKGSRLQGYTSLFFKVRELQTKTAAASVTDKAMRMLRDGVDEAGGKRLDDMGLTRDLRNRIKGYIDNGVVEFQDNGYIDRLNMDQWEPKDAHEFAGTLTRFVHQVIQKDLIGESSVWMHKDAGALFSHLQQFPLLAMQKQLVRNARLQDGVALGTLLWGLTTAGLAYAAKQAINGRTDKLDPVSIAKGAITMSNMTGLVPMMWDPIATMVGADDWRINSYGRHAEVGMPALDWMNKAIRIPGAALSAPNGLNSGEISAMKALPFGNAYGTSVFFDVLRE
jgi:hypothetical protein